MIAAARFQHEFVTSAPRELSPGVLYVSLEYCTMLHLCACGCGRKVVTPISPNKLVHQVEAELAAMLAHISKTKERPDNP